MMDFNDVTPMPIPSTDGNREEIRASLLSRLESVLMDMFPAGKVKRGKFLVGDILGSPGDSLEIVVTGEKAGLWTDRATALLQARTVNEVVKAQTNKVRLARLKGELIDRPQAIAHVFKLARSERDAWLNWPARVSAQMAAKLELDAHTMHVALENAVREHLQELGNLQASVD